MEKYIIDRIEEGWAICEGEAGNHICIAAEQLPEEAKEGDCLIVEGTRIVVDREETEKRRAHIRNLMLRAMSNTHVEEVEEENCGGKDTPEQGI
ncbi:MAG: DUF3006 domain-containing protein [Ruminococcaceae bacterium]|nr:DUF3006 domain-containing protein [Oscillospiraceae bacterium]